MGWRAVDARGSQSRLQRGRPDLQLWRGRPSLRRGPGQGCGRTVCLHDGRVRRRRGRDLQEDGPRPIWISRRARSDADPCWTKGRGSWELERWSKAESDCPTWSEKELSCHQFSDFRPERLGSWNRGCSSCGWDPEESLKEMARLVGAKRNRVEELPIPEALDEDDGAGIDGDLLDEGEAIEEIGDQDGNALIQTEVVQLTKLVSNMTAWKLSWTRQPGAVPVGTWL